MQCVDGKNEDFLCSEGNGGNGKVPACVDGVW